VREIGAWLMRNAGTRAPVLAAPEDRITRTPWFIREHRKVPQHAWARVSIKSAANCAACHPHADQGDFDEHAVRIPR
jgi:nitrate/TMAO reductase-like tetraheme cytochrome c subunit